MNQKVQASSEIFSFVVQRTQSPCFFNFPFWLLVEVENAFFLRKVIKVSYENLKFEVPNMIML